MLLKSLYSSPYTLVDELGNPQKKPAGTRPGTTEAVHVGQSDGSSPTSLRRRKHVLAFEESVNHMRSGEEYCTYHACTRRSRALSRVRAPSATEAEIAVGAAAAAAVASAARVLSAAHELKLAAWLLRCSS